MIADQFYAERLYNQETLTHLLEAADFSRIACHGDLAPQSRRNQDLGMMERRLIVTGQVKKAWTPVKRPAKATVKEMAVILGDPHKPDIIKPDAVFDEDDFYTIDQLKSALAALPDYHVTYLNNHDTLIQILRQMRGKVDLVFNLCDEGYRNDPRRELHVPALLELLNLPYTGSGPQCLAYCYDKSLVRGIAREMDIPVPAAFTIEPGDAAVDLPLAFPVIVKPNYGDSSFGITQRSVANTLEQLVNAISEMRETFGYD